MLAASQKFTPHGMPTGPPPAVMGARPMYDTGEGVVLGVFVGVGVLDGVGVGV